MEREHLSRVALILAGLAVVAAIVVLLVSSPDTPPDIAYSLTTAENADDAATGIEPDASQVAELPSSEGAEYAGGGRVFAVGAVPQPPPEEEQEEEESGMDPEEQPRTFYIVDYQKSRGFPQGYLTNNVMLTDRGIELARDGQDGALLRSGVVESPTEAMDFSGNALCPLWKEELPEGAKVEVEVAVSPDGIHWGDWHPVEVDDDAEGQIQPYYPDGRSNPNYGFTPGGMMFGDTRLFNYFRFRFTLIAEGEHSPVLSGFRMFYQDSTLGKGRLADFRLAGEDKEDPSRAQ